MLWLALHFPRLPLDTLARGTNGSSPLAVASSAEHGAILVTCNRAAGVRGVRAGMTVTAAWALVSDLKVVTRDEAAEQAALERLAAWALQFTPTVSIAAPAAILLEVKGSLKLFGGLRRLHHHLEHGLAELGYDAHLACAPTPRAAQLFARAGLAIRIQHGDALRHELQKLPIELLDLPADLVATLARFGVQTIGECLRLPRDGVARRLGQQLLDDLDRASGRLPDPRPAFVPPPDFGASLSLPTPVEQADALLFAARRLLIDLCGWLGATGHGAQSLCWRFAYENYADTRLVMKLLAASRDADHMLSVLRERLAGTELPRPVVALALRVKQFQPLAPSNLSFLPEIRHRAESVARLVERLRARLGEEAVCGLATCLDHRPERAWRACSPGNGLESKAAPTFAARPLWLLASPLSLGEVADIPHYDGPLSLVIGPERIETGWWDGHDVARDYFVACNPAQSLLWIYREHGTSGGWYLHGFFS